MSWHLGRMVGFDLETTGIDPEVDRIVTACVVRVGADQPTYCTAWFADPGVEIPEAAAKVHGITTERARAEGQPAAEAVAEVVAALAEAVRDGVPVVAMNASFDLTLLDREARRHGVQPLTDIIGDSLRVLDPLVLDKEVDRYRRGRRTLGALCAHYGLALENAHSADADASAACQLVRRLAGRWPQLRGMQLDVLHRSQVGWAARQAYSLADYMQGVGRAADAARVRPEWPLVPVPAQRIVERGSDL